MKTLLFFLVNNEELFSTIYRERIG